MTANLARPAATSAHERKQTGEHAAAHVEQQSATALPWRLSRNRAGGDPLQKGDPVVARGTQDVMAVPVEHHGGFAQGSQACYFNHCAF
jgi:hypothetical protein